MGAQNFRHFQGRTNNSVLGQFFFNVPKIQFFHDFRVFWSLFILGSKGGSGKIFYRHVARGENFVRVFKGDKNFRRLIVSDSLGAKLYALKNEAKMAIHWYYDDLRYLPPPQPHIIKLI